MEENTRNSRLKFTPAELAKEEPNNAQNSSPQSKRKLRVSQLNLGRLKFTPAELAKEKAVATADSPKKNGGEKGNYWTTSRESDSKVWLGRKIMDKLGNAVSDEISDFAEKTDDRGVQAADKYRRGIRTGTKLGRRVRRYRQSTAGKREIKKQDKLAKREFKTNLHLARYNELPKKEHKRQVRSQKRNQKRKQIRNLCEKAIGPKKTELTFKVLSAIARGVGRIVGWLVSFFGWSILGVAAVAIIFGICVSMLSSFMTTAVVAVSSYTATDADIEAATMLATKLEAELEQEVAKIPSQWKWGHIDEFRYNLDPIGHNPWQLMGYLSVVHPGFEMGLLSPVPAAIERLHGNRYTLELDEERETRYKTETYTDPITGEKTKYKVPYTYYILNVRLHSQSIESVIWEQLQASPDGELLEWYQLLGETGGARQEIANPFDIDWRGLQSSLYGYRIDPVGGVNLQVHRGLDIPQPHGTPIKAGVEGKVRYVGYDNTYGNYILLQDNAGTTVQYAHCDRVLLTQGDTVVAGKTVIATVGNSGRSSSDHVHIEIKRDGHYINPIYAIRYESED